MPDRHATVALLARQALDMRDKAERFRTADEGLRNWRAREALIRLAKTWDDMAAQTEIQAKDLSADDPPQPSV
jgi:hypothetical protein